MPEPTVTINATPLTDIPEAPVAWVWPGWLPRSTFTLLDGDPGVGKSLFTAWLAAHVTRALQWPGDTNRLRQTAGVMLACSEDNPYWTLRPRLEAAGADPAKVHLVGRTVRRGAEAVWEGPLEIPNDLPQLREVARTTQSRLLILDPLTAFFGRERGGRPVNALSEQSLRRTFGELSAFCEAHDVTVLAVRHLIKRTGGAALFRGVGGIALAAAARSVLYLGLDPDDPSARVLASLKSNLGAPQPAMSFRVAVAGAVPRLVAGGSCSWTAAQLLAHRDQRWWADDPATVFLRETLRFGEQPVAEVLAAGRAAGFSGKRLDATARAVGVVRRKEGMAGGWLWRWP